MEYRITPAGTRHLDENWQVLLDHAPPSEIEAVFRIVGLGVMTGADLRAISTFLRKAAGRKAENAMRRQSEAARLEPLKSESWESDFYACLQARYAALRLSAESKFLRDLARALLEAGD